MTKHLFSILVALILSVNVFGQTYKVFIRQADSLYNLKNYKKSNELYQKAFKLEKKNSAELYNGACTAALSSDKKNAFVLLELAFQKGWINIEHLKKDPDLESLHNDKRWMKLTDKMQKKIDEIEINYDKPLQKELLAIFADDQTIRGEYVKAANKLGYKNHTVDSLGKIILYKDSINLIKVTRILDEKGWVGKDKVGGANQTLFLVIQHSDLKTQEKYLPMMREAVKKGDASAGNLALLEDRILLRQGKKQVYGSQIYWNEKTNKLYIAPLEDPDNVDKRRAEAGLESIADYAKNCNIIWNLEEYKKQLPELELLNKK